MKTNAEPLNAQSTRGRTRDRTEIEQFGALCLREAADGSSEVLLITTRETKRWTIPKGWPIKGLKAHEVAEREAWEEAGVLGRAEKRALGHFRYLKRLGDGRTVPAMVKVHLLRVRRAKKSFPEWEERTAKWVQPHQAAKLVCEPRLQRLLRRMATRAR